MAQKPWLSPQQLEPAAPLQLLRERWLPQTLSYTPIPLSPHPPLNLIKIQKVLLIHTVINFYKRSLKYILTSFFCFLGPILSAIVKSAGIPIKKRQIEYTDSQTPEFFTLSSSYILVICVCVSAVFCIVTVILSYIAILKHSRTLSKDYSSSLETILNHLTPFFPETPDTKLDTELTLKHKKTQTTTETSLTNDNYDPEAILPCPEHEQRDITQAQIHLPGKPKRVKDIIQEMQWH